MKTLYIFVIVMISTKVYCQSQEPKLTYNTPSYTNPVLKKVNLSSTSVSKNFKSRAKGKGMPNNIGQVSLDNQSEFKLSKKKFALEMSIVNQRRAQLDFKRIDLFVGNNGKGNTTRNEAGIAIKLLWNHWKSR